MSNITLTLIDQVLCPDIPAGLFCLWAERSDGESRGILVSPTEIADPVYARAKADEVLALFDD